MKSFLKPKTRIIVIDNDEEKRRDFQELLEDWGFHTSAAEGVGLDLLEHAKQTVRQQRCHLALVDLRLLDDGNLQDQSGLKLAPDLLPARTILLSAYLELRNIRQALTKTPGVFDVHDKADPLDELREILERATEFIARGTGRPIINWPLPLNSADIRNLLFPHQADIPEDEADDVIGRTFCDPKKKLWAYRVQLTQIDSDDPMSPTPRTTELLDQGVALPDSEQLSTLRRQSRVFTAHVDQQRALYVVKVARVDKIEREVTRFKQHVEAGTIATYRPEMVNNALLWDMGAVVYRHLGGAADHTGTLHTLTAAFRRAKTAQELLPSLRHFFDVSNWGGFYQSAQPLGQSLFAAYDTIWHGALSAARASDEWRGQDDLRTFPGLPSRLPNPLRWFRMHTDPASEVRNVRQAVTHGDLHGDNLFINHEHAWPIDFERTSEGPILRDFVELIQDVTTRIAILGDNLPLTYELAVTFCEPRTPNELPQPTSAISAHQEARKTFEVVRELLRLAHEHTHYTDRRELLWAMLFNHLFIASRLKRETPRWLRTLLWASVICGRLARWQESVWPPQEWPMLSSRQSPDQTLAPSTAVQGTPQRLTNPFTPTVIPTTIGNDDLFRHGYALVIGVGTTPYYPEASLPVSVSDAQAIAQLLLDPTRCAYPRNQVQLLTNEHADHASIERNLRRLGNDIRNDPKATVFIYFSGHGWRTSDGRYALVPSDVHPDAFERKLLWANEFTTLLQGILAQRILVCLDACHAGGMATFKRLAVDFVKSPPSHAFMAALAQGEGRVIISSSRADQSSYYRRDATLSIFTDHLIEALSGAASRPGDTTVKISQLMAHLSERVPATARAACKAEQTPWIEQSAEDFPVALIPSR